MEEKTLKKEELDFKISKMWKWLKYCGIMNICLALFFIILYFLNINIQDGISELNIIGTQLGVTLMNAAEYGVIVLIVSIILIIACIKKSSHISWIILINLLFLTNLLNGVSRGTSVSLISIMLPENIKNINEMLEMAYGVGGIVLFVMIFAFGRLKFLEHKKGTEK